jgi:hypothetical protein
MAKFPPASDALHTTVVVPTTKVLPDGGEQMTIGLGSHLSVAVGTV